MAIGVDTVHHPYVAIGLPLPGQSSVAIVERMHLANQEHHINSAPHDLPVAFPYYFNQFASTPWNAAHFKAIVA